METTTFITQLQQFIAQHTIMVVAWVVLLILVIVTLIKSATNKVQAIDNTQAILFVNKQDGVFIDLRTNEEYDKGHIVHSLHLLPSEIKNNQLRTIEKYKEVPVILTCNTGINANASAALLVKQGFTQVYTLKEGIAGWKAANLPLVKR